MLATSRFLATKIELVTEMSIQTFNSGFKFRIYPNTTQRQALAVNFGHARFVYNRYLTHRSATYQQTGKGLSYNECAGDLVLLKKDPNFVWLKDAYSQVLQQSLKDLDRAFGRFFKNLGKYPRFKNKHGKQTARFSQGFKLAEKQLYLPKAGWVKTKVHRELWGQAKSITVSKTKAGKYFASILCEWSQEQPKPIQGGVGIDLGLTHFAILSTGEKIDNPRNLRRSMRRLKIRQRRLSRKEKGSANRIKARLAVSATHERIANQRKDFHHKVSHTLARSFGTIKIEDLHISGMLKNHNLAQAISDAGWNQFITFLSYKVEWENGHLEKVDRWFASSKTCSVCGWKNHELKLHQREWTCQACGAIHDRDVNAAQNILSYELPMEHREVTPVRDDQPVGSQGRKPCTFRSG